MRGVVGVALAALLTACVSQTVRERAEKSPERPLSITHPRQAERVPLAEFAAVRGRAAPDAAPNGVEVAVALVRGETCRWVTRTDSLRLTDAQRRGLPLRIRRALLDSRILDLRRGRCDEPRWFAARTEPPRWTFRPECALVAGNYRVLARARGPSGTVSDAVVFRLV